MKRSILIIPLAIFAFSLNFLFIKDKESLTVSNIDGFSSKYKIVNDKACSFCHSDKIKHEVLHAPVDDCESCHQSTGNKHPRAKIQGFTLAEKTPDLCYICHESKGDKQNVHSAIKAGGCNSCHSPHGSNNKYLLSKSTSNHVCAECHDFNVAEKNVIHAPIKLDGCLSCHDSHQSDNPFLLVEEKSALCITCHDNIEKEKQAEFIHAPFDDDCSNCHSPHNSKESALLVSASPDLCFTCHDDIQTNLNEMKHIHKVSNNTITCQTCHSPHSSSNNKLLVEKQEKLCYTCHNTEIISETRVIENIENTINTSKYKHSILEIEGCSVCHNPHASNETALLTAAFPKDEYAIAGVETFELCFNCHDSGLLTEEKSSTSTNFRNADNNLHFIHINGDKGRNCNICHDVHASNNQFLINKRVKFGSWNMPMNFLVNNNGGSCRTGCHTEKKYTREHIPISTDSIKTVNSDIAVSDSIHNDTNQIVENIQDVNNNLINDIIENQDTSKAILIDEENMLVDTTTLVIKDTVNNDVVIVIKETTIRDNDVVTELDTTSIINDTNDNNIVSIEASDTLDIVINSTDINTNLDSSNVIVVDENSILKDTTQVTNIIADIDEINVKDTIQEIIEINNRDNLSAIEEFKKMTPLRMFFLFAKTDFEKNADEEIIKLVSFMNKFTATNIQIEGHTDHVGSIEYNHKLSNKRAKAIKDILISRGIVPKRIQIKAFGELKPIDSNNTDKGRANNRRVEVKLFEN